MELRCGGRSTQVGKGGRDLSFPVFLGVSSPGRNFPASLLKSSLHTLVESGADANTDTDPFVKYL